MSSPENNFSSGESAAWSDATLYRPVADMNSTVDSIPAPIEEQLNGRYLFQTPTGIRTFMKAGTYLDDDRTEQALFLSCDENGKHISKTTPNDELLQFTEIVSLTALQRYFEQAGGNFGSVTESSEDWSTPKFYDRRRLQYEWSPITYYMGSTVISSAEAYIED